MKKYLSIALVLLFALVMGAPAASAATGVSGYMDPPYWYTSMDVAGNLINPSDNITQNSAEFVVYEDKGFYRLTAHPNYRPYSDDWTSAITTTVVTSVEVFNGTNYEQCLQGGSFLVRGSYVRTTAAGIPYLQFKLTLTEYDNYDGSVLDTFTYDEVNPIYFNLNKLVKQPQ